jgi:hypothetical protein
MALQQNDVATADIHSAPPLAGVFRSPLPLGPGCLQILVMLELGLVLLLVVEGEVV